MADLAGVSPSLVSLVLRGSLHVSERRRAAVVASISALGYRPSHAARTLASRKKRTKCIGFVVDDYRSLGTSGLVQGIQTVLRNDGYKVAVTEAPAGTPGEEALESLLSTNVEGLVLSAECGGRLALPRRPPGVVVGWSGGIPPLSVGLVASDDRLGGVLAGQHLLNLGHSRVVVLTSSGAAAKRRCTGFLDAMHKAGVLEVSVVGENARDVEEDGYRAACQIWDSQRDITAIFATSDYLAVGALAAIRNRGDTPEQTLSVIGYGNTPLAKSQYIDLTSVDVQSQTVGEEAAKALLAHVANPGLKPRRTLVKPILTIRSSTRQFEM
ncbi:LacI family DNA-binding transcriptional regulator [Pseudarthrobacter sp. CC12]|uniref:LacI family DNA-binding transcriptional regulator n=1 Tax=Pseudarthrobacter sp. CC12 TaxID=3029193 RepID=UPI003265AE71